MTQDTRAEIEQTLVDAARETARKLADTHPKMDWTRRELIANLREIAIAYAELRTGHPSIEVLSWAGERQEIDLETERLDYPMGDHEIRLGHGAGWVVMNLYEDQRPRAAWDGTAEEARRLGWGLIRQADHASASFTDDETRPRPPDSGSVSE